jgi:2-hydroxy-6-oxonona-2,4-dienedioate hydrolase
LLRGNRCEFEAERIEQRGNPGTYASASPVAVEESRASALVLLLVNSGADFAWWATEKIAPSILIRFIGVRPELFASSPRVEQERVMQIVRSIEPLSRRFSGINIDSNPDLRRPPLQDINVPTLVISARDDLFNTLPAAEFAASTIPNAELVVYDTGGHLLVGRQQEVRKIVSDFLARHSSRAERTN